MHVRVIVRVQVAGVEVVEGQRGQQVDNEPATEVVQGDALRVGHDLALARHERCAEVQDDVCAGKR